MCVKGYVLNFCNYSLSSNISYQVDAAQIIKEICQAEKITYVTANIVLGYVCGRCLRVKVRVVGLTRKFLITY